jgi:diguanylate cyclase (GGDEF)-like protein
MGNSITASQTGLAGSSNRGREQSAGRSNHGAELALKAFMSMSRAVAIVGPDGKLLLPNFMFEELFGKSELLDIIGPDASRNGGKSDRQIDLADGRSFWVETIPMDDGWLVSAYNMTERLAKARMDTLTKLGNRLMFHEQLTELLANSEAVAEGAAVLSLDLARFKAINDSLGRHVGQGLLCLVADRIRAALDEGDLAARLGGDKFAIIQTGQPQPQSAAALASRLVDLIGRPYVLDGQLINTAASVGIALFPDGASGSEQILKHADIALHRARHDGQNSYRFFEKAMDEMMQARQNLEIDLRRALVLGEFALVYQPQLNLLSKAITGFEALLRWRSPSRGAVSPLEFIPVAEETGIINQIGEWVLRNACRVARPAHGRRQCFGGSVREPQPGNDHPFCARRKRPRPAAPGA